MKFNATKTRVLNRGIPPESFLTAIVLWAKESPDSLFEKNPNADIYSSVAGVLGPYESLLHRKAVMLEVMRVHAGFESSWNWNEGVDTTNATSMRNIEGQETGIFQVSFDSTRLGAGAMKKYAQAHDIDTPQRFIPAMKRDHDLALDYYAHLIRVNVKWAGPIVRGEIHKWLSRSAVDEFKTVLT